MIRRCSQLDAGPVFRIDGDLVGVVIRHIRRVDVAGPTLSRATRLSLITIGLLPSEVYKYLQKSIAVYYLTLCDMNDKFINLIQEETVKLHVK